VGGKEERVKERGCEVKGKGMSATGLIDKYERMNRKG
jgi:hypothetical protein